MPEMAVNGTVLHYEEDGSGEPLLLLHGGGGTARLHYRNEIPELARRFHVIAPDMRGYGTSSPPRLYPPDFYAQDGADMAALLRALGAFPAHVCGWSDGSIAGLILAVEHPELVRTLCVWGSEGRILPEERECWKNVVNWQEWPERTRERFIAAQGPQNWPGILERMLEGYSRVLDAGGEIVSQRLHQIQCPTLILHGDQDDVVPVAHAYELERLIPHCEMHIFPGAGHTLHRERHDELMRMVGDFIERHRQAGATGPHGAPER
jgi:pimeloyl-ACP methyl ester carboxylesterase